MPQPPMVTLATNIPPSSIVCLANLQREIQGHGELGGALSINASVQLNNQIVSSCSKQVKQRCEPWIIAQQIVTL
jgi:hypothetical protein